jgi:hypothetical protein
MALPALADDVSTDLACKFHHGVSEVGSFDAMPPAIVSLVRGKMHAGDLPNGEIMAPRGGDFNATDVITNPKAPGRRFIRAGHAGDIWFLWYEHGGIAYTKNIAVIALKPDGPHLFAFVEYFSQNPCVLTDAVLDGKTPAGTAQTDWW